MARLTLSAGFLEKGEKDRHTGAPSREQTAPLWARSHPDVKQGTLKNPHLAGIYPTTCLSLCGAPWNSLGHLMAPFLNFRFY